MDVPLLDGDFESTGILEPAVLHRARDIPQAAVLCFFPEVVQQLARRPDAKQVAKLRSEIGPNPVWEIEHNGTRLAVLQPGVGAPLAAAFLEEIIAFGVRGMIACGAAGALVPELTLGYAVIVDSAVRDEGTSYHYLPPARTIDADPHATDVLRKTLATLEVPHRVGRTWTTDAIYRETRNKARQRVEEGCLVVDMEASALFAVAQYRGVTLGQLLLAGDSLAGETWDHRGWTTAHSAREKLFWLAADAAVAL
ncbi:MAG TPA: nucleoside phosphorylase [Pseudonocardiaceae bacterium]|jgi:uridine phosphorylase|nr:nucleoside phosphorylase [Pseudonocardiaceae bacterium]